MIFDEIFWAGVMVLYLVGLYKLVMTEDEDDMVQEETEGNS